jgi:predicted transposase YbfD/YdcC
MAGMAKRSRPSLKTPPSIVVHFGSLEDPRQEAKCEHLLVDILVMALVATICGAQGWAEIADFAESKETLLRTFLELPNGIPSVHTFQRVISRLKPKAFNTCFQTWIGHLEDHTEGRLIALDGKTLRGAVKRSVAGHKLHLVHAWCANNRLLLGQLATDIKSNEIPTMTELLGLLDLSGAVVTIDAMGCQTEIAEKIRANGGHYVLAVKGNQPSLHAVVKHRFADADVGDAHSEVAIDNVLTVSREDRRRIVIMAAPAVPETARWVGLKTLICVQSERRLDGTVTEERRYYITDLPTENPARLGAYVRNHWSVENQLHWQLDVSFREDESTVSAGHGAENLSLLNKIALTLLTREPTRKRGIAVSRKRAGWDDEFLLRVLSNGITE